MKKNYHKVSRRHPSFDFSQLSRHLSRTWDTLSEDERYPYIHEFVQDWRRWKREMHLFHGGHFRHSTTGCCHCCQGVAAKRSSSSIGRGIGDCTTCSKSRNEGTGVSKLA